MATNLERVTSALQALVAAGVAIEPIVAPFVPGLDKIVEVAKLIEKAGEDVSVVAPMVSQVLGGSSLTPEQDAQLDATYDRLSANLMRERPLPPGS